MGHERATLPEVLKKKEGVGFLFSFGPEFDPAPLGRSVGVYAEVGEGGCGSGRDRRCSSAVRRDY